MLTSHTVYFYVWMPVNNYTSLRNGTLTRGPLCREGHLMCRLKIRSGVYGKTETQSVELIRWVFCDN